MRPPNSGFFRFSRAPKAGSRCAVCLAVVFGLVGVDAAAAGTTARPATSTTPPSTISVPHARFQVLSPTLIHTEYAGDDKFENRATFNAVGRNAFSAPARYTSSVSDGLLTITTSALTLHYRVGSGPFTTDHLTVRLKAGPDPVLAAPWQHRVCVVGALCEAEDQVYDGPGLASNHAQFTGKGFLAGF